MNIRLRAGGSDDAGGNYFSQRLNAEANSITASRFSSATEFNPYNSAVNNLSANIVLYAPFLAEASAINWTMQASNGGTSAQYIYSGLHNNAASFDGFSLIGSSNFTQGKISVYGYKE